MDHVIIDDGEVAPTLRQIIPPGVDVALELVGAPTLHDTLRTLKVHGVACFTGMLSNSWVVKDFYPIDYLPQGVRLTAYSGDAAELPSEVLEELLAAAADDHRLIPLDRVFPLDQIAAAHDYMQQNPATGKIVVVP